MYEQCIQFWIHSAFLLQLSVLLLGKREDFEGNFSHEEQDPYTYTEAIHVKRKKEKEKRKKKLETVLSRAGVDIFILYSSLCPTLPL